MQNNVYNLRLLWFALFILVGLFGIYEIGGGFYLSQTTGSLKAKASNPKATLTVSMPGHKMVNIGYGNAKVRLAPGSYKIYASLNHLQASSEVQITKKQASEVNINLPDLSSQNRQLNKNSSANSLIKLLPYTGPNGEYIISYKYTVSSGIANPTIVITAPNDKAKQDALAWITHIGFSLSDLKIEFQAAAE
jgi:hypothetical protein